MSFGGWSIDLELFNWMKSNISEDSTILEFGSGNSTSELVKIWKVISIEEDINWINRFHENYIYAPLVDKWYDFNKIKNSLDVDIDVILIDGPAYGERIFFLDHIDYFLNKNPKVLIFDDTEREKDFELFLKVIDLLKKLKYEIEYDSVRNVKMFSYIKIKE